MGDEGVIAEGGGGAGETTEVVQLVSTWEHIRMT